MSVRGIGLGIAGWGAAGRLMAAAVGRSSHVRLAGVADLDESARGRARQETGVPVHADLEALVAHADVDAVYVATPTSHHPEAVALAAAYGTHVVCEKPLAPTVEDALAAASAARAAGTLLLVGATHSYDAPVRVLRDLVEAGDLGALLSVESSQHSDWHRRPRRPQDFDLASGNGLVLRQGAHQFDIVRYVAGGAAETLVGTVFGGSAGTELGFAAQVAIAGGVHAGVYHAGVGAFDSRLQSWGVGELGAVELPSRPLLTDHFVLPGAAAAGAVGPVLGRTVATFERGGVLLTARGLLVLTAAGVSETTTTHLSSGWDAVLEELRESLLGAEPRHTGEWAAATLELCLAVHRSAATGTAVDLRHQVPLPPHARLEHR